MLKDPRIKKNQVYKLTGDFQIEIKVTKWWKLSRLMTKTTQWHVRPAKTQISPGIHQFDQSLRCPHEETLGP